MTSPDQDPRNEDPASHSAEVLGKLEALLGRLRGADTPAAAPAQHTGIPTLTEPVSWSSPEPTAASVVASGAIPTLTESVELHGAPPAALAPPATPTAPAEVPAEVAAAVAPAAPAADDALPPPAVQAAVPMAVPTAAELRAQVLSMLDPSLQSRLSERAMAELDETLLDIQRDYQAELLAWRDDQAARIRDQVRGEIDRAVDNVVEALLRRRDTGRQ